MNPKSLAYGTVAGFVALFAAGFVLYELLLGNFYAANMDANLMKAEPDMLKMSLSNVVYAFFLTFVFSKWAGIKTAKAGATAGAIIGLLLGFYFNLGMAAWMNGFTNTLLLVDPLVGAVWAACGGAAVGFALGKAG